MEGYAAAMPRRRLPEEEVPGLQAMVERRPATHMTIGEMTYSILREAILTGALPPGQKLRQEALAETLNVSRIPVRSALMQLETEGLVEIIPHRGARVRRLTADFVKETYRIRTMLEVRALERSVRAMTPERADHLLALARRLDAAKDPDRFLDDRVAFYQELYDAERNPVLVGLIDHLRRSVGRDLLGQRVEHQHGHQGLAQKAADGDLAGARAELRRHLSDVSKALLQTLEQQHADDDREDVGRP